MCSEIGSLDCDNVYGNEDSFDPTVPERQSDLHEAIFSQCSYSPAFTKSAAFGIPSESNLRVRQVAQERGVEYAPLHDGSIEFGGKITWGDKDGTKFEGYGKGGYKDDYGRSATVKIERDSDGKGGVSASGKYEWNNDNQNNDDKWNNEKK